MTSPAPVYIETYRTGLLDERIEAAKSRLECCTLCPRACQVDRLSGETGVCKTGAEAWVSSYGPHFGEEAPLTGTEGSGTIFFTHCNLLCLFCQNYDISHGGAGEPVDAEQIARVMLSLEKSGCHNINFVTPSHVVPQILTALKVAIQGGLSIPLVYNSSGYDSVETLALLEGVIDIYMPDFKFWNPDLAERACDAPDYPDVARNALIEMHRQVGDLVIDAGGIARRGLLVRHLVLPAGLADTGEVMRFIADRISANTYVNIMPQYRPCGRAAEIEGLEGFPSRSDFEAALKAARDAGITRLDEPRRIFMMA
jgi:putative pyruvate formate lyase activating enzyme